MKTMTHEDFETLTAGPMRNYYLGRWAYYKEVIKIIRTLDVAKVLELGPGCMPLVKGSDIMLNPQEDQFGRPEEKGHRTIFHDATVKPWPIGDREYDLLIALQVWEHLDNKQSRAFKEVLRVSKKAILSFPYLWNGGENNPSHRAHRDIDRELIGDWTLNVKPQEIIEIGKTGTEFGKGGRLILYWNFP